MSAPHTWIPPSCGVPADTEARLSTQQNKIKRLNERQLFTVTTQS